MAAEGLGRLGRQQVGLETAVAGAELGVVLARPLPVQEGREDDDVPPLVTRTDVVHATCGQKILSKRLWRTVSSCLVSSVFKVSICVIDVNWYVWLCYTSSDM